MESTQIAGFSVNEADKIFGAPDPQVIADCEIVLRAPLETRADFMARHAELLENMV